VGVTSIQSVEGRLRTPRGGTDMPRNLCSFVLFLQHREGVYYSIMKIPGIAISSPVRSLQFIQL
jgi:hypothetical protein